MYAQIQLSPMELDPLILIIMVGMIAILVIFYIILRLVGMAHKSTAEQDRAIMEALGDEPIHYSNDYFNKLAQPSRMGDNLPTRACDGCGAAINPGDKFCVICGKSVEIKR